MDEINIQMRKWIHEKQHPRCSNLCGLESIVWLPSFSSYTQITKGIYLEGKLFPLSAAGHLGSSLQPLVQLWWLPGGSGLPKSYAILSCSHSRDVLSRLTVDCCRPARPCDLVILWCAVSAAWSLDVLCSEVLSVPGPRTYQRLFVKSI